jgi:hypothetical protein
LAGQTLQDRFTTDAIRGGTYGAKHAGEIIRGRHLILPQLIHLRERIRAPVIVGGLEITPALLFGLLHASAGRAVRRVDPQHVLVSRVRVVVVSEFQIRMRFQQELLHLLDVRDVGRRQGRGDSVRVVDDFARALDSLVSG